VIAPGAVRDRQEPRQRVGASHVAVSCAVRTQEALLEQRVRLRTIAKARRQEVHQLRRRQAIELVKGAGITVAVAAHEVGEASGEVGRHTSMA
jgi:hypothetical protein